MKWRSNGYAWLVVSLLSFGSTLSLADRVLIVLLFDPIKHDLNITDTQVSLLHGFAFTALYLLAGLPLARISDKASRKTVITLSIAVWSLATVFCGWANSFKSLFIARMSVGIGEAGLTPAANSIIMDYFPADRTNAPIALLAMGGIAGSGFAMIMGGALIQAVSSYPEMNFFGGNILMKPWQATFVFAGLFGILYSLCMLVVREPPRASNRPARDIAQPTDQIAYHDFLKQRRVFLLWHFIGFSVPGLLVMAVTTWTPTLLMRRFAMTAPEAGYLYGVALTVSSVGGVLLSGWLGGYLMRREYRFPQYQIARLALFLGLFPAMLLPFMSTALYAVIAVSAALFFFCMTFPLGTVALQLLTPNHLRAQIYATYLIVLTILTYIVGPTCVALISDYVFHSGHMIHWSITIVIFIFAPLGMLALSAAGRAIDRRSVQIS